MFLKSSLCLLLLSVSGSLCLISFGSCPEKNPVANFDLNRFSGFWYENRALEGVHLTQESWGSCLGVLFDGTTQKNVSLSPSTNPFSRLESGNFTRETTTLSTLVLGQNHTGAINADFVPSTGTFKIHGTWRFLSIPAQTISVLDTDYDNYALLWSCQDMGSLANKQTAWILTRAQTLTSTQSSAIINSLFAQGLPENQFRVTDQSNCRVRGNRKPFFSPLAFSQVKHPHQKVSEDIEYFEKGY